MIHLGHVVGVPDDEGEDFLRATEIHLHPLRAFAQENDALVGCFFVAVGQLGQVVGGHVFVAASDFTAQRDVLQAGRDHHWRARLVRVVGLRIGVGWDIFGRPFEGRVGQFEHQGHQGACGSRRILGGFSGDQGRGEQDIQDSNGKSRQPREQSGASQRVTSCIHYSIRHSFAN